MSDYKCKFKVGDIIKIEVFGIKPETICILSFKCKNAFYDDRYEFFNLTSNKIHLTVLAYNSKYVNTNGIKIGESKQTAEWLTILYG